MGELDVSHRTHFLPRNAMHKRGLCCRAVSVRLSVCLSVTFVYSVKTTHHRHILKLFFTTG